MKNLFRFASAIVCVATMMATAWSQALFKELPAGKWWVNRRIIQELRLTPEQQAKIEAVWLQSRRVLNEQKLELEKRQAELAALLVRGPVDEAAALKSFDEFQQARHTMERNTFLMRMQIRNLLSAEQQPKIEAIAERLRQDRPNAGLAKPSKAGAAAAKK